MINKIKHSKKCSLDVEVDVVKGGFFTMNNDINKKDIKIKMGAVVFSDLLTMKETSARLVSVGQMSLSYQKKKDKVIDNEVITSQENNILTNTYTKEDLEREGNESLF